MAGTRERLLLFVLLMLGGAGLLPASAVAGPCDPPNNEIVCENSKAGTPSSVWDVNGAGASSIQGFATEISVDQGETIQFKVNTPSSNYRLDIYRMGYYGGDGARKVASVEPSASLPQSQPSCDLQPSTGLVDCGKWAVSASWVVPASAVSGIYFAKLEREDVASEGSHIVFVVRDDDGESELLFQTSDTTWQAYNQYGGNSLYVGGPGSSPSRAYKVSYNRPLTVRQTSPEDSPFNAEYPMVRWLERNGYDVSYASGVDSDRAGEELLEHEAFLSVGHDEYWSGEQRANVEAARDAGVHLAFFSGNEIFWKTRWEQSISGPATDYRTLVCFKETHANGQIDPEGPEVWTGTWRDPRFSPPADGGRPENALSGTAFMVNAGTTEIQVPAADGALRFWRGTDIASLSPGETATLGESTLGYEWDEDLDNGFRPPGLVRLSSTTAEVPQKLLDHGNTYDDGTATHHLTLYRAASGALVFSAGTVQWAWGLDPEHDRGDAPADARMQQATVNLFADMGVQPQTLQAGLLAATASSDTAPPGSTIASPSDGGEVELDQAVTISGTAADSEGESEPGGEVGAVEVSVDGGETWHPAEGRNNWSYTWFPEELGETTVLSRAVDDSGNIEPSPGEATVEVVELSCPCTIWNETVSGPQDSDTKAVELGTKFRSDTAGFITGLRFYKTAGNTGTHVGRLWTAGGTQLAQAVFSGETASGWQEVKFDAPVEISADTTYVAAYHAPNGQYASIKSYFAVSGFDNPPLHALANGVDGPNGIYEYGPAGALFADGTPSTFQSENYLVDVVFEVDVGPDETAPQITGRSPVPGGEEIGVETPVSATFSEALDPATVSGATVQLRDAEGAPMAATVGYDAAQRRVTLDPDASLLEATTYTATIKGGAAGVKDLAGNPLAADAVWSFTTVPPPPPPPDQGPGGPILVISNAANPFSRYYGQILEAEGLNEYTVADIATVTPAALAARDVAILGEGTLSAAQATMLSDWVQGGGNLIAMRPDPDLHGLLGLGSPKGTLANGYIEVDTSESPGAGIVGETIQFHGSADRYAVSGAETVATLFADADSSAGDPAVTVREVGPNGGHAAAFTYDLARSVVYTRQGNPAWSGDERDGLGAIRSDDLFFGAKAGDAQPDWIDFDKVDIPQADEQQRLLTNLIGEVNLDRKPLPRFWFLPRDEKAAIVMTGDDHGHNGSTGRFESQKALDPPGCSVAEWECIRSTSYIYPNTPITDAKAAQFVAEGFELGLHVTTGCNNWDDEEELEEYYDEQLGQFAASFPSLPPPRTSRTHCIVWSDWASQPKVELKKGIRLDTTYYYWPASWVQNRPGMFTGSGMPMRFVDLDGSLIDVYQAATQMTDESEQAYPFTSDALLDRALGPEGYYGVFTANMHTDKVTIPQSTAIVESALARDVPIVSARQMLTWLDGRNQSSFGSLEWDEGQLTFTIDQAEGANGLRAMLPVESELGPLLGIERGATPVATTTRTIKGVEYAFFDAESGAYTASYVDAQEPEISDVQATVKNDGTATVTWQTNEPADSRVDYGTAPGALTSSVSDPAQVTSHSLQISGLEPGVTYHFRVTSADGEANATTEPDLLLAPTTFVTPPAAPQLTATDPASPANANAPKVIGTAAAGASVSLYASADCSGPPLASGSAAALASGIAVSVADDSSTAIRATATTAAGTSLCSAPIAYVEDSVAPETQIALKPADLATATTAKFEFTGDDGSGSGVGSFECRLDAGAWSACTSPREYTSLGEGAHSFEVKAIDAAGNADATPASFGWTIDSKAAETQLTATPPVQANSAKATFEFTGDDGAGSGVASFQCKLDGGAFAACSSGIELTGLAEGGHEFSVRAIDQAGNIDPSPATHSWTVDLTPPAVTVDSGPEGLTNDPTPTFAFGSEPGAGFECSLDAGTPDFGPCSDAGSHTAAAPLTDGPRTFRVRASDAAGNQAVATRDFTVDATAPTAQLTLEPAELTNSATAKFEFTGNDGSGSGVASFQCKLDDGSFEACSSGIELAGLAEGAHTFEARAIDNAGNTGAAVAHEWTVDLTAPTVTIDSLSKALLKAGETSELTWHASENGAFQLRVGGSDCDSGTTIDSAPYTGQPAPATSQVDAGDLAEGANALRLCLTDAAGNRGEATVAIEKDTTAPTTQLTLEPAELTNSPTAKFEFTGDDGAGSGVASFQCKLDDGAFEACSSGIELTGLAEGAHTFEARAIDNAGNTGAAVAHEWSVDSGAPETQITAQPPVFDSSATANFSFTGSDTGGSGVASFECRRDSEAPEDWQPCLSPLKYTSLAQGLHVVEIRAVDKAGNVDGSPARREWTIDSKAPETQIDAQPPVLVNSAEAGFAFSGTDPEGSGVASFQCRRDSAEASAWAQCSSPHAYAGLADGPHTFEVRAVDQAGNADASPASHAWTVDTTPPPLSIESGPEGLTPDPAPSFGFAYSPEPGDALECSIDAGTPDFGPCASGSTHAPAGPLANGAYTFRVRATDGAGNTATATREFQVDATLPDTEIATGPPALVAAAVASFAFTGEDPEGSGVASFQCKLDSGAFSACSSGLELTGLAEGGHEFAVRAIDQAGNVDPSPATHEWTVDTQAPETAIGAKPALLANSATAKFEFTGNDGSGSGVASFQCKLDDGSFETCSSGIELTGLAEGGHEFAVRAIDQAGNTDATAATYSWTIDSKAPETQIDLAPPALANSAKATFEFSGEDPGGSGVASFQCRRDSDEPIGWQLCSSPLVYTSLAEGVHTFEVRAVDQAGGADQTPATFEWEIDTKAPNTQIALAPPVLTGDSSAEFEFSGEDVLEGSGVASFQCKLDGGAFSACSSGLELTGLAEGGHEFAVRAIDQAGNVDPSPATHSWTVDLTPPAVSVDSGPEGLTNDPTPTFAFGSEPGAGFQCSIDAGTPDFGPCSDAGSHTPAAPLADGPRTFRVRATDAAGNQAVATRDFTVDATAPTAQLTLAPTELTNSATAKFEFTGDDGTGSGVASFQCKLDDGSFAACASGIELTGLSEGAHTFEARAIDNAGNTGPAVAHEWTVDLTAPTVTIDSGPEGPVNNPAPTFAFSSEPGASFQCSIDEGTPSFGPCSDAGSHTPAEALADGPHTFRVRASDAAGNQAVATRDFEVDTAAPPAPELNSTVPPSPANHNTPKVTGTAQAGTSVNIYATADCSGDPLATVTAAELEAGAEVSVADNSTTQLSATVTAPPENTSLCSQPLTYVEDSSAPGTQLGSKPPAQANSAKATFQFTGDDGSGSGVASFQCKVDGGAFAACSSGIELTGLAEGGHEFSVRAIDQAGNIDPSPATHSWTVDLTPPAVTVDSGPEGLTNDPTPTFAFGSEPGAGFECSLDAGTPDFGPCSDAGSHTAAAPLTDGPRTFRVRATDAAGNQAVATRSFVLDATAPTAQLTLEPAELTNSATAKFEFTGDDGSGSGVASFQCKLDDGSFAACASGIELTGLSEGAHTFEARAIDNAGNTGNAVAHEWSVDTVSPGVQITSQPAAVEGSATAKFEFTGDDGSGSGVASFQCKLDEGAFEACASGIELSGLSEGAHTFEARAIDNAGNAGEAATHEWSVDTTAPTAQLTLKPSELANSATAKFEFTGDDGSGSGVASFQCKLDDGSFEACASGIELSGLAEGAHEFAVRAIDDAGNTGNAVAHEWTVDLTVPTVTIDSLSKALLKAGETSELTWHASENGAFQLRAGGSDCDSGTTIDSAPYTGQPAPVASQVDAGDLAEGANTLRLCLTDAAGNRGEATVAIEKDTTAPTTQLTLEPAELTNSATAKFEFTGNDGSGSGVASFQCKLDEDSFEACSSGIELTGLAEGAHSFSVRAIDNAGNTGAAVAYEWTVDLTPPAVSIDSGPEGLTNDPTPTFAFGSEPGATFECSLDAGTPDFGDCSDAGSHTAAAPLSDGPHTFRVRATDAAGNQAVATRELTVDTAAPQPPELEATAPPSPANDNTPQIVGSAAAGTAVRLYSGADCNGAVLATVTAAELQAGVEVTVADDSTTAFRATATSAANNTSGCSQPLVYVEDSSAPQAEITAAPPALTNSATAEFEFSGDDGSGSGVASFQCKLDSGAFEACSSGIELTGLAEGAHTFEARAIDNAGNTGAAVAHEWTVDLTPPAVTVDSGPEGLTNDPTPTFAFGSEPGATFECSLDAGTPDFGDCSDAGSHTAAAPLADGPHTFRVRATDAAGNQAVATRDFTVDATAPSTQLTLKPTELTNSATAKFEFTGDDGAGSGVASFQCKLDEDSFEACSSGIELAGLAEGAHSFSVRAIDNAGNTGAAVAYEWTVDLTPPAVSIDSGPEGLTNDPTPTFAFGSEPGATFECSLDAGTPDFGDCSDAGSHTAAAPLSDGPHTFRVRATDAAGNQAVATRELTVDTAAPQPPELEATAPPSPANDNTPQIVGSAAAGTAVRLYSGADCNGAVLATVTAAELQAGVEVTVADDSTTAFRATATSAANNTSGCSQPLVYVEDSSAPQAEITAAPPALTNSATAEFEFSGDDGSGSGVGSFQCRIDPVGDGSWSACASPHTYAGLGHGHHTFQVRAVDSAGNIDPSPAIHGWQVDLTIPTVTIDSLSKALLKAGETSELTWHASENGAFQLRAGGSDCDSGTTIDSAPYTGQPAPVASQVDAGDLAEGANTLRLCLTDAAGNRGEATVAIEKDTTAPTTQLTLEPAELTNSATAKFEFTGNDGSGSGVASFQCKLDDGSFEACSSGIELTGLIEGAHTFEARAIDDAGNTGAAVAHEWSVDTVSPGVQITSQPAAVEGSATAKFEFTGNDGSGSGVASFQCKLDDGSFEACASGIELTGLAEGAHTFSVRAIDNAGNTGAAVAHEWTVDLTAPTVTIDSLSKALLKAGETSELTWHASENGAFQLRAGGSDCDSGTTIDSAPYTGQPAPATSQVDASDLAEGANTLRLCLTDAAGNRGEATVAIEKDTALPDTEIAGGPPALTNSAAAEFEFTGNDGAGSGVASFQCRLDSGSFSACASPHTYAGLGHGHHTFQVRAVDSAGNVDPSPAIHGWQVDLTVPTVTIDSLSKALLKTGETSELTWHASENGAFQLRAGGSDCDSGTTIDSAPYTGQPAPATSQVDAGDLAEGANTLRLCLTDAAGNRGEATVAIEKDTTAPSTQLTLKPTELTNSATAKFEFTGDDGAGSGVASFQCKLDEDSFEACSSGIELTGLAEGAHSFSVRAIDNAGNTGAAVAHEWTVDLTVPTVTIESGPEGFTDDASPTFAFGSEPGATFECSIDAGTPDFGDCSDAGSHTPAAPLADGPHTFRVRVTDSAGSQSVATRGFTVDTAAPSAQIGAKPAASTNRTEATFEFSGDDGPGSGVASFQCKLDEGAFEACSSGIELTGLAEGAHTFEVRAIDDLGHVGDPTGHEWTVDLTTPTVTIDSLSKALLKAGETSELTWHASENGAFQLRAGGSDCDSGTTIDSAPYTGQPAPATSQVDASDLAEGANTLRLCLTDAAGNRAVATRGLAVDTTAPNTQIAAAPAALSDSSAATFGFSGNDGAGSGIASFQCRLDGGAWTACSSPWQYSGLGDGAHSFAVRAIDQAGNADTAPAEHTWAIDTTVPQPPQPPSPPPAETSTPEAEPKPPATVEFIRVLRNRRKGTALLLFKVSGPGLLSARPPEITLGRTQDRQRTARDTRKLRRLLQRRIKPRSIRVTRPGQVKVPIELTAAGKRLLRRSHRLKVSVVIRFRASGGSKATWKLAVTLEKQAVRQVSQSRHKRR